MENKENIEQINDDFNEKKPNGKGLKIALIIGIVLAIVLIAVLLIYFLLPTKPEKVFNSAIDSIFKMKSEEYDSIKVNTKMKVSIEAEKSIANDDVQTVLEEIEKCTLKFGTQMDLNKKEEIVDLGLEYDKEKVGDVRIYYADSKTYAYLDGLFDKYIKIEIPEENKELIDQMMETMTSKENIKNTETAMTIFGEELKAQIVDKGEFEQEKVEIEIDGKDKKVTKSTLILTEKQLNKIISNTCTNLADNDKFLKCFEQDIEENLEDIAEEFKDVDTDSKNKIKIAIYTEGLSNKLVGIEGTVYDEDEDTTIIFTIMKEENKYNLKLKEPDSKENLMKATIEIQEEENSKNKQSGKAIISAEIKDVGKAKLEIEYTVEYNDEIDKIDVSKAIDMKNISEDDIEGILEKLKERPLIGDAIKTYLNASQQLQTQTQTQTQTNSLTTEQNEVKDKYAGYSVKYSVPANYKYDSSYSKDYRKYYESANSKEEIDISVYLGYQSEEEYKEDIDWDYNYDKNSTYYKNANLSEIKTIKVGDKTFKYQILTKDSNSQYYEEKYQNAYIWYSIDDDATFSIEIETTDKEITEDMIKGFLNINVTKIAE